MTSLFEFIVGQWLSSLTPEELKEVKKDLERQAEENDRIATIISVSIYVIAQLFGLYIKIFNIGEPISWLLVFSPTLAILTLFAIMIAIAYLVNWLDTRKKVIK